MLYRVTCADKKTAAEFQRVVIASTPAEAAAAAARACAKGTLIGKAEPVTDTGPLLVEVYLQLAQLNQQLAVLSRAAILRSPAFQVFGGVLLALILLGLFLFFIIPTTGRH